MISPAEILEIANKPSHLRSKAEAMGFTFMPARCVQDAWTPAGCMELSMDFTCVCGKLESVRIILTENILTHAPRFILEEDADLVSYLWRGGSFSREHLVKDGYSEAQIADILAKGEAYDRQVANKENRDANRFSICGASLGPLGFR